MNSPVSLPFRSAFAVCFTGLLAPSVSNGCESAPGPSLGAVDEDIEILSSAPRLDAEEAFATVEPRRPESSVRSRFDVGPVLLLSVAVLVVALVRRASHS